jgi:LEA14-like dessication related protein
MNIKQESRIKMSLSSEEFLVKNEALTKDLPEFAATFAEFRNNINQIKLIDEQQSNVRTGIAKDKREIKNSLITIAAENSGKIFALAKVSNNKPLMDEVHFSISELGRMTDVSLRSYAEALYKKAESLLEPLAKYGVNADSQKKFSEALAAYDISISKPRVSIAEKREVTKKLEALFTSLDATLSKLDAIIGIIRYNEVSFYNGYRTVRKLVNTNAGVVALKAIANDKLTSSPIKGVVFTFKSNGTTITKKTADKGSFHIRNMKPGGYEVTVKKEGYKEKVVTVNINDGERSELAVELEKV